MLTLLVGFGLEFVGDFAAVAAQTNTNAASAAVTNVTAIPTIEIAGQSEAALGILQAIESQKSSEQAVNAIRQGLPGVLQEVAARAEEGSRILSYSTSLELFARLESSWRGLGEQLADWKRTLSRRARQLQSNAAQIEQLKTTWQLTESSLKDSDVPPELAERVNTVLQEIGHAGDEVRDQLSSVLSLETRVSEQNARILESANAIELARQEIILHLLARDSSPIWNINLRAGTTQTLAVQGHNSLARQYKELCAYGARKSERFIIQIVVFVVLLALLVRARHKLVSHTDGEEGLAKKVALLEAPGPSALLLTLLLSPWLYSQAPRLLWSILGIIALIPASLVLRRVLPRRFFGIINVLVAFYLIDQLRAVAASQPLLWRALFLAEMAIGALYTLVVLRSARRDGTSRALLICLRAALLIFAAAFVGNVFGFGRLSGLLGTVLLSAAYLALMLYAAIRVGQAMLEVAMATSPLAKLAVVRRHRSLLGRRFVEALKWVAVAVWLLYLLERLALRHAALQAARFAINTRISMGSLNLTLGHTLLFAVALWASFLLSRLLRFILEEEVYPHVRLAPGVHYSISKTLHYAVLLVGFLVGLALLGFNLTKLTILAGAFGVGLGFGMQNIVNNFVSGIILLFERPVKVGDVVQLDSTEGVVKRIGIRASIVRTVNGSEIIVPNAKLISDPVTNWTFSQRQRLITIPVTVASDAEPPKVIDLLRRAAGAHPLVAKEPSAQVLLTNVANGSASFELRTWTDQSEDWQQVRSDLFVAIRSLLATEKIPLR